MSLEKGAWDEMGVPEIKVPRKPPKPSKPTISPWERAIFGLVVVGWLIAPVAAAISVHGVDMANAAFAKTYKVTRNIETCQTGLLRSYPPCRSNKKGDSGRCIEYMSAVCSIDSVPALQRHAEAIAIQWRTIAKAANYAAWFFSLGTTLLFYGLRLVLTGRLRPLWPLGKHD
jgi:hypothetical protein